MFFNDYNKETAKSGPKTRFQSDFYTLLIICVPPIILGQVLRYFPTVVAIRILTWPLMTHAIEWSAAKTKMAENEHVKRARVGRPNRLTSSATKREKSENDAKWNRSRIHMGEEFGRWTELKTRFGLKHAQRWERFYLTGRLITKSHI